MGGQVTCVPLKGKYCIWQQLQNHTSLCCVCTVTPVSHERTEPTAGWCLEQIMQPRAWMPHPCSGGWQSHLWPIFQSHFVLHTTVLCLLGSSVAMVGVLLPVQPWVAAPANAPGRGRFPWHRHEAAAPIVPVVNSGWLGLAELGPSVINSK